MNATIGWGILGTGKIARILAAAVAGSPNASVAAVGSRSAERSEAFAREFGIERWYPSYAGVIEDDDVDLVYVATNHPAHREWAVRAAEAGKHVLCEKPMAVNAADAAEIVGAAKRCGVFLMEAFAYRCHRQTRQMLELVRDGAIGEIRMIDAVFGYDAGPEPENYLLVHELAGGAILDVGCYTTSMSHLVGAAARGADVAEPIEVGGAGVLGATGVDLSSAAALTFEGGPVARVACSIQANLDSAVRIYGSTGRIAMPSPWLPGPRPTIVVQDRALGDRVIEVPVEEDVYAVEVEAVSRYVLDGERSPSAMSWDESLANMRTLDRWRAAIGLRFDDDVAG